MAKARECAADGCTNRFDPTPPTKLCCSTTCRTRRNREARNAAKSTAAERDGKSEHRIVTVTRNELVACKQLDTVTGQIALQIARRIADPKDPGLSAFSKELRSLMDECRAAGSAADPAASTEPGQSAATGAADDEVDEARRARELKLAAAAERSEVGAEADRA